jgi:predicted ATPase
MKLRTLSIQGIKGFADKNSLVFSPYINIFVGQNNSGKSTILNSIFLLQSENALNPSDISIDSTTGYITIALEGVNNFISQTGTSVFPESLFDRVTFTFDRNNNAQKREMSTSNGTTFGFSKISNAEPNNLIYPYLSKRKVVSYEESVNLSSTNSVTGNFTNLYAKLNRLCNINHPNSLEYQEACKEIIGFPISTVASPNGQQGAYIINSFSNILLSSMGEGVPNLLGLIVDLCIAEDKVFLVEEPENDIHPKALKALLELIATKSINNQFFISTHSNIVTKYLGSVDQARIYKVSTSFNQKTKAPLSRVALVENEPSARLSLLEELGYEPFDFGQWKAWLILEESSAEIIIRDYLIPMFVPKLKNVLRSYSATSLSEVEPKFRDFNNLFVFIHLEQMYKNKAWVIIDSGEKETSIINELRERYEKAGWESRNFLQFSQHNFECYYPKTFENKVTEVIAITDKSKRRNKKKELVEEVKQWANENPVQAKDEFAVSAREVIDILKNIAKQI